MCAQETTPTEKSILSAISICVFGSIFPIPSSVIFVLGVYYSWRRLRDEGISGYYAETTALTLCIVAVIVQFDIASLDSAYHTWNEMLFLWGIVGLVLNRTSSSILAGLGVSAVVIQVMMLSSTKSILAVGLVASILINMFFSIFYIPGISDVVPLTSAITIIGFLLSFAFILDSKAAQTVGRGYDYARNEG